LECCVHALHSNVLIQAEGDLLPLLIKQFLILRLCARFLQNFVSGIIFTGFPLTIQVNEVFFSRKGEICLLKQTLKKNERYS